MPGAVFRECVAFDNLPICIQFDQVFRNFNDLFFNMLLDVQPFRRPQAGRNRLAEVRTDIIRNPIGLMNRDVKLVARGI